MDQNVPMTPVPIAYQLVMHLVPVYPAPVMLVTAPVTTVPAVVVSPTTPNPPSISEVTQEASLSPTRSTPSHSPPQVHQVQSLDDPASQTPELPIIRLSPQPMDFSVQQLAASNPDWEYLAGTQPISPPSSSDGSDIALDMADGAAPQHPADVAKEREEPRSGDAEDKEPACQPIASPDPLDAHL